MSPCPRVEPLEPRAYLSITLTSAQDFGGVGSPAGIATADFNMNGVPDVALVGIDPTTGLHAVGVYLDGANPVFIDLPGDNSALDITTADFNGDSNADIAVTDPADGTVNVLLGNGDGTFQAPIKTAYGTSQPAGSGATAFLVTADFNGDSKPDLAVTDPADHQISILLGNGDGTFALGTPITSTEPSFDPQHIVTADFNFDNFADLIYGDGTAAQANFVAGDNTGGFAAPVAIPLDGAVQGLATASLKFDGQSDLIASVSTGTTGAVDVVINASGIFAAAVPLTTTFANPGPLAVADIDGDGAADIVTMNASGELNLFPGNGDGTFQSAIESQATTSGTPLAIITTDVTGDNKSDILFSETNSTISGGGGFGLVLGASSPEILPALGGALPASAISGTKTPIIQTLSLTNTTTSTVKGTLHAEVALSTDDSFSSDDTIIDSIAAKGPIAAAKSKSRRLKIPGAPAGMTPGNYFVVVEVMDPNGGISMTSSTGTINIIAPTIDFSGTFKTVPGTARAGKHFGASIIVTNNGNVPATGKLPIVVDTSLINTLDDTAVPLPVFSKKVNIKPGKSVTIQLSRLIAPMTANSYFLIVQLDPTNTLGDVNPANNVFATGGAIVVS